MDKYIYVWVCLQGCMYVGMCVYMCAGMYIHVCLYVCVCMCVCSGVYVQRGVHLCVYVIMCVPWCCARVCSLHMRTLAVSPLRHCVYTLRHGCLQAAALQEAVVWLCGEPHGGSDSERPTGFRELGVCSLRG